MYLALGNRYITQLKNVLQFNYLYIVLFIIVGLFLFYKANFSINESIFDINDTKFVMEVKDYETNDKYISLTLCNKECLIGNYYFNNINEIDNIKYGSRVSIEGVLEIPSNNTIPNCFNYKKYLNNKGIYYVIKISKVEIISNNVNIIYDIRNYINNRIDSIDDTGYMKAFILGSKDIINDIEYSKYQVIGVTHLFALSGMHISVIVLILNKLLCKLNNKIRYIVIDVILIIYGFILYFPASLKRTIVFYIINSLCKVFNIKISSIKVLLLVLYSLVIYNYKIIYDIGFIYSFITVFGIVFSNEFIKSNNKLLSYVKLSIIAFSSSLPISLYYFYSINVFSIIYNLFYILIVSNVIYPLSLICFILPKLYIVYSILIDCLVFITDILSKIDIGIINMRFNIWEVIIYYVMLFMFIKYRRYVMLFGMGILLLIDVLIPYMDGTGYVYFFDVGQGDSSLIISPYRKDVIFIDTGGLYGRNVSDDVINFMKSEGIRKVDYLILTHGDFDHMGEAVDLVKNFKVEKVIFNCGEFNELELDLIKVLDKKKISYYSCIKELNIDNNKLYFLNNKDYSNENDNSSIIYTELNNRKFLFMGDVSIEVEEDLIKKYNLNNIDVLKVGHHGSKTSSSEEFINKTNPKYSIISVGKNNRYGHPNDGVLDNLEDSKIYRTDIDGSIIFKIKNNRLKIETCSQ